MAILTQGILGPVAGKTGPVVSYIRFGQNITRSKGSVAKNRKETPGRKIQREKIAVCNAFTRAFSGTGFFSRSFPAYGHTGSGYNRVTSSIMNLAITGTYPYTAIVWPNVLVSKGPLPSALHPATAADADGNIYFSWTDNTGLGTAKADDKAVLVAFFPELKQAVWSINTAHRSDCLTVLPAPAYKGYAAETWMGFLSNDERDAADSVYCGVV